MKAYINISRVVMMVELSLGSVFACEANDFIVAESCLDPVLTSG